jgi:putative transposase
VKGRKRHVLVDTMGLLLVCVVHGANVQDRDGGKRALAKATASFGRLRLVWADGGYAGKFLDWVVENAIFRVELILRQSKGWELLPKRWVVERTFAWLNECRRLSKDYETTTESSEAFVQIAMIHLMLRRLD